MSQSFWADITEDHTLVAYKQQTFNSQSSGSWEAKIMVPADMVSGESLALL